MDVIRSASNPAIKRVRAVASGREAGCILLEGDRLVDEAVARRLPAELCLVAEGRPGRADELEARGLEVRRVQDDLLQRASDLVTSPGVLLVARAPGTVPVPAASTRGAAPLVVVASGIADPGNLGALARTAEAAGAVHLVVLGGASPWNPKALRGSMGSLLRLPVCVARDAGALRADLAAGGWRQVRAATREGADHTEFDWTGPLALWLASETGELPPEAADLEPVSIPMAGEVESLNVTAAAAVLLFAAGRTGDGPAPASDGGVE